MVELYVGKFAPQVYPAVPLSVYAHAFGTSVAIVIVGVEGSV